MMKRGSLVCIFGTLSFIGTIYVIEALVGVFFGKETVLINLIPGVASLNINGLNYLIASLALTSVLLAVTFKLAFTSPLENYLNTILSDANMKNQAECEMVVDNRSVLDMMCESITYINEALGQTKDITYNIRSELVNLRSLPQTTKELGSELKTIKKEIINLKKTFKKPNKCPSCGNTILTRFKICPYCGEALQLSPEKVIVTNYK